MMTTVLVVVSIRIIYSRWRLMSHKLLEQGYIITSPDCSYIITLMVVDTLYILYRL